MKKLAEWGASNPRMETWGTFGRGWVNEEFAAAIEGSVRGRQRLIPVLFGEVELPPFVASRLYIDFRYADSPDAYLRQVQQLVRAIKAVGNYGEMFSRNVGEKTPLNLPRGVNNLWNKGGIQYAPPIR